MTDQHTKVAILLNGPPRAGKDTAVAFLEAALGGTVEVLKFTRPVKDLAHARFGIHGVAHDHFETNKDTPLPEFGGMTPREAYIDTSARRKAEFGEDAIARMFVEAVLASGCDVILNPDVGDDMEAELVADALGADRVLVVRIHRDGHDFSRDCRTWVASERLRSVDIENVDGRQGEYEARIVDAAVTFLAECAVLPAVPRAA